MCVLSLILASVGYCVCVCVCVFVLAFGLVGYCVCVIVCVCINGKPPWPLPRLVILTMTSVRVCVLALASVCYY